MDETYIKVKGGCAYLDRAVEKLSNTLDLMLSTRRNKTAATEFFASTSATLKGIEGANMICKVI
ncbi:putative transposase [Nitratireductor indicus C115]|uniref:Putative transposase n=1 Tax=Nitratireductor indicus C115 TaxID=1231190 RepID=K2P4P8_9HYPH|nr:putative transposase [Nitratireductor indicus C115]SFQ59321.1 DDE domain-containing protein [Nitratireductor indicus]